MQPLNYCRKMIKQFTAWIDVPSVPFNAKVLMSHAVDLAQASQKFILPNGGFVFDDPNMRALEGELNLPYPFVALEFLSDGVNPCKFIIFARDRDDGIVITTATCPHDSDVWCTFPDIHVDRNEYLERSGAEVSVLFKDDENDGPDEYALRSALNEEHYAGHVTTLLMFLNALQCSNVKAEKIPAKKQVKTKCALGFDDYHVLTIQSRQEHGGRGGGSGHRSPREHLRRGHLRRYENGQKIWVNATMVNAGVGGKVNKDYRL